MPKKTRFRKKMIKFKISEKGVNKGKPPKEMIQIYMRENA